MLILIFSVTEYIYDIGNRAKVRIYICFELCNVCIWKIFKRFLKT